MQIYKIGIDPGHGGADAGAVGMGYNEKDTVLNVALKLRDKLQATGRFEVTMSRDGDWKYYLDQGADLNQRARVFNAAGVDAVLSIHMNSAQQAAWGTETFTYDGNSFANNFGDTIHAAVINAGLYSVNRGRKWENFAILRETDAVAALSEMAFINSNDIYQVLGHEDAWAEAFKTGICNYFGVTVTRQDFAETKPKEEAVVVEAKKTSSNIISEPSASIQQMQDWARNNGATQFFINLAPIFYDIAHIKGVNPTGAYAQSAKETGFGRFGGVLDESYKNPCGMKTTAGGGNYDPNAHQRFETWEEGITAQVDHLLLYAGHPQQNTPDPRHFTWLSGKAVTWEALGGNWAPSLSYGKEIVGLMSDIEGTQATQAPSSEIPEWAMEGFSQAVNLGITTGERPLEGATRLETALMIVNALEAFKK